MSNFQQSGTFINVVLFSPFGLAARAFRRLKLFPLNWSKFVTIKFELKRQFSMWLWPKQRSLRNIKVKYFFTGIIYDKDLLPFPRYSRIRKWLRNHRCIYDTKWRETLLLKQSDHQLSRMKIFSPRMQKNFHHHHYHHRQVELTRYSMTRSFHISL